ncbi:MAG: fused MFS/spermidine synthase [Gemmatimonadales bacterium]|jgi:spermidine synthase|nr:MAG: fused MFS/spermidine synthase [Gemmatimonadales bacterium]
MRLTSVRPIQLVFIASIFLSAFLLFLVQPLVTRMLLPVYGGSPAVWNTALVFFQVLLLLGYLYAFVLSQLRSKALGLTLHSAVLILPLLLLPPSLGSGMSIGVATSAWPAARLLLSLWLLVAAPFFTLSSNSSLVQWWWTQGGFRGSQDPYWLYAASNTGSLIALLCYPFVLEPSFGVLDQARLWSGGYALFVVLTLAVMVHAAARPRSYMVEVPTEPMPEPEATPGGAQVSVGRRRVLMWIVRSAVGSSLLLSVSTQITTDLAPTPLLWVVPLALFLLTFIVAFGAADRLPRPVLTAAATTFLMASVGLLLVGGRPSFEVTLFIALGTLFFGALLCHRDLAAGRPGAKHLTAFYLWISLGGALGGTLNGLVAPLVFDSVAEMPLTLMAVAFLVYVDPETDRLTPSRPSWIVGLLAGAAFLLPVLTSIQVQGWGLTLGVLGGVILWSLASARYVGLNSVTVGIACILVLSSGFASRMVERERSFFGVISIVEDAETIQMIHGTTVHGMQWKDEARRAIPSFYYHPSGPMGSLMRAEDDSAAIGIVGLGTGGLAGFGKPGQRITYFEIDPLVEDLAREHFTFLGDSPADVSVVIGDGRLELEKLDQDTFDLLIIDAFSSDFIPVHLLTDEALDLYIDKVKSTGLVVFHISSRHADLRRVLEGYARARGRPVAYADYSPSAEALDEGAHRTIVGAFSESTAAIQALTREPLWTRYAADISPVRWTDDYSNILSVLN